MGSAEGVTLLGSINHFYAADRYDADLIVFLDDASQVKKVMMFAVFNATEVFDFSGDVVATDLVSASRLLNSPGPRRRFLYLDGPQWSEHRDEKDYAGLAGVYRNPRLEVVAGSDESANLFRRCWNREVIGVAPLDDMDRLVETLKL